MGSWGERGRCPPPTRPWALEPWSGAEGWRGSRPPGTPALSPFPAAGTRGTWTAVLRPPVRAAMVLRPPVSTPRGDSAAPLIRSGSLFPHSRPWAGRETAEERMPPAPASLTPPIFWNPLTPHECTRASPPGDGTWNDCRRLPRVTAGQPDTSDTTGHPASAHPQLTVGTRFPLALAWHSGAGPPS